MISYQINPAISLKFSIDETGKKLIEIFTYLYNNPYIFLDKTLLEITDIPAYDLMNAWCEYRESISIENNEIFCTCSGVGDERVIKEELAKCLCRNVIKLMHEKEMNISINIG